MMKRLLKNSAIAFALVVGLVSCNSSKEAVSLDALSTGTWELVKINGKDVQASDYGRGIPTVSFSKEESRISGNGGCNTYSGPFTLSENASIEIGPVMSTKMACMNGGNGESVYFKALDEVNKIKTTKDKVVFLKDDTEVLEYKLSQSK